MAEYKTPQFVAIAIEYENGGELVKEWWYGLCDELHEYFAKKLQPQVTKRSRVLICLMKNGHNCAFIHDMTGDCICEKTICKRFMITNITTSDIMAQYIPLHGTITSDYPKQLRSVFTIANVTAAYYIRKYPVVTDCFFRTGHAAIATRYDLVSDSDIMRFIDYLYQMPRIARLLPISSL
jgi:hypothetical protein